MLRYSAFIAVLGVEPKAKWLGAFAGVAANTTKRNVRQVDNRHVVDDVLPGWTCGSWTLWFAELAIAVYAAKIACNYCEREFPWDIPFGCGA